MANLSDYLKAINTTKENIMESDPMAENEYHPFVVNRTLSYFLDTVLYANEANIRNTADKKLQFDLLLNSIRSNRRFSRWLKPDEDDDIDAIKEYYGYSNQKAKEVLGLLTGEQLSFIHKRLSKGGIKKDRREKGRTS